jgi:pilus assembly protein FimV
MKTAVRRILLMSALMSPGALYALGLGEIHLNSALNQPFDADIELVSATQEDLGALRAALASGDTFTRYGLDRPAYLSDFSFRVAKGPDGQDVLKVTSPRPVTEPFVTLLVEASWPRGRLLREYTVLLDPPIFAPTPAAAEPPVATPRASSAPAPAARTETFATESAAPAPSSERRTPRTVAAASPDIAPGSTYRVQPNDTLWQIASAASPGSRSDVNRAMVAIFQGNPQAFDGNINVLRSGSELKIPASSEIAAISASAASAEVARQYQMWKEGGASSTTPGGGESAGRLRLVTPEQGTAAPSTSTGVPPAGTKAADLQARIGQLESELAEARRLLEVRNAELATLQGQAAGAAPAPGTSEAPAAAPTEVPVEPGTATAPAAAEPAAPVKSEPAKPTKQEKKKRTSPPAPPEGPTLFERVVRARARRSPRA